jgi:hypothetical protein
LDDYQHALAALPFGKRLPMALHVYRRDGVSQGEGLDRLETQVVAAL